MEDAIKQRGFFWWLTEPNGQTNSRDTSVPGLLTVSQQGHIRLSLDRALWYTKPLAPYSLGKPRLLPRGKWIVGSLGTNGDGDGGYVLLDGLERTDFHIGEELQSPQSYEAEICITAKSPFSADFNLDSFNQLRVELAGLEEWLNLDSIIVGDKEFNDDCVEVKVKYRNHNFLFDTTDGKITIESLISHPNQIFYFGEVPTGEAVFTQRNSLTYTPNSSMSLNSLLDTFACIEELLALLLGSYFRLGWPTLVQNKDNDGAWYRVYSFRGSVPEFKPQPWFMWANFNVLRESFGDLFNAWKTQLEKYGSAYYLYLAELRNPLPYSEHKFVNLMWALESLHERQSSKGAETPSEIDRKAHIQSILNKLGGPEDKQDSEWFEGRAPDYQKNPVLSDRIFDSLSTLPIALDKDTLRTFSERCKKWRDAISHGNAPPKNEAIKDLPKLAEAFSYLYHALLLHDIGLDAKYLRIALTKGGLAEIRILPALRRVGLSVPETAE